MSILYSCLITAFLAIATSCSMSQISILLYFSSCIQLFSTSLLRVAQRRRHTTVSLTFMIFLMTSFGKLWMMTSLALLHIRMYFFQRLTPTSSPLSFRKRLYTGYFYDYVQSKGYVLFQSSHFLTPWLEMLKYSLGQLSFMMIFLNSQFAFMKEPTSLAPFLEQILILLQLISQKKLLSMSVRKVMLTDLLYLSSSIFPGSSSMRLLVVFQKRQTLGFKSIDQKMAISSRSSLHSSQSGRCTSKGVYYFQIVPSLVNFQKQSSLSSSCSSEVRIARQFFLAQTNSIIDETDKPQRLTILKVSRETTLKVYIPNTPTSLSLMALSLGQKMSSLESTSRDALNLRFSRSQMNSWVPSMSTKQGPSTRDSQREGLQRQYLPCWFSNCDYYFMLDMIQMIAFLLNKTKQGHYRPLAAHPQSIVSPLPKTTQTC